MFMPRVAFLGLKFFQYTGSTVSTQLLQELMCGKGAKILESVPNGVANWFENGVKMRRHNNKGK